MNDFWTTNFWAKPITTMALGMITGCVAYAAFGTLSAGLMGFGAPSGLWIVFEIVRAGGMALFIDF